MGQVSSVSKTGKTEPFELQVSRGHISYHTTLFKYGYNPLIINVNETVWDAGGIYVYPSSAVAMTVTSAAAGADEGVSVTVIGLDADWNEVQQEVTLNASGVAVTTQTFLRVYRAFVSGASEPTGNITIANGGTTYAQITLGENQTLMSVYSVPAGHTLLLSTGTASHGTDTTGAYMTIRFVVREFGGVMRTATKIDVTGGEIVFPFEYPLAIPEKSDIEVRAICSKNQNNAVSATFQGVLVKNNG